MPTDIEKPETIESVNDEGKKTLTTKYQDYTDEERKQFTVMLSCGHPSIDGTCRYGCEHEVIDAEGKLTLVKPTVVYNVKWDPEKETYIKAG